MNVCSNLTYMTDLPLFQYMFVHNVNVVAVVVTRHIVTVLLSVSLCGQVVLPFQPRTLKQRQQ